MCIIVAKNKGVKLPTKKVLKNCFEYNNDGAGLMYVKDNQVIIEKGFMTFEDFYNKVKELKQTFNSDLTEKALVFHFRIRTSGESDSATTHPFPISKNEKDLRALKITTNVGMAHNGIISSYTYDKTLSDTQTFIRDYVSVFKELDKRFYENKRVMQLLKDRANSKLCFLDNKENIYCLGEFVNDNDVLYSNNTYKQERVKYNYNSYYDNSYYRDYYESYYKDFYKKYELDTKTKTKEKTTKNEITINDFLLANNRYDILSSGDYYMLDDTLEQVKDSDYFIIDEKNNLYDYTTDTLSLIGTDVKVYDKNKNIKMFA